MADFLDSTFSVNYVRETPAESYKLMNIKQKVMSTAYEGGERNLQSGESAENIVNNITHFFMVATKPVRITLSSGVVFEAIDQFSYGSSNPISVSIENTSQQTTKINYAAGLKSK